MGITVSSDIKIKEIKNIRNVREFEIRNYPSMHPTAVIVFGMQAGADIERYISENELIHIVDKNEKQLFAGYIQGVSVDKKSNNYQEVELQLVGQSIMADYSRRQRSFQNTSFTYDKIMEKVLKDYPELVFTNMLNETKEIGAPVIQYEETDWEFLLRMASAYNMPLFADETKEVMGLYLGADSNTAEIDCHPTHYYEGVSKNYYINKGCDKSKYGYYRVISEENYPIGGRVNFKGNSYVVCQKEAKLEKEELYYEYLLAGKEYIKIPQKYNSRFIGCTILGEIVKTEGEKMELKLRLKDEETTDNYYAYPWKPEAGNLFYCMPKKGAVVSLYFPSDNEKDAMAINCIRREKEENQGNYSSDTKYFLTEDNKSMILAEDAVHFITETINVTMINQISLIDLCAVMLNSQKDMNITCNGLVMSAPVIHIAGESSFDLIGGTQKRAAIEMLGLSINVLADEMLRIDLSKDRLLTQKPVDYYLFPIIMDQPEVGEGRWTGKMVLNAIIGGVTVLAVAALCAFALPALLGLAGVAAGTAAAVGTGAAVGALVTGTFAVVDQAKEDFKQGEADGYGEAFLETMFKTIGGAIEGGICALAGPVKGVTGIVSKNVKKKFLLNLAGNAVNKSFEFWADQDKGDLGEDSDKLMDYASELLESSIMNLITTGAFDVLPDALDDKVKNVKILNKIKNSKAVSSTIKKAEDLKLTWNNSKLMRWWKRNIIDPDVYDFKRRMGKVETKAKNLKEALEAAKKGIKNKGDIPSLRQNKKCIERAMDNNKLEMECLYDLLNDRIAYCTYMEAKYQTMKELAKESKEALPQKYVWAYRTKTVLAELPSAYKSKMQSDGTENTKDKGWDMAKKMGAWAKKQFDDEEK